MMTMENKRVFRRGEVYIAFLPEDEESNIQGGLRPIVIMSNDRNNLHSSIVQFVPITGHPKRSDLPVHKMLTTRIFRQESMALCEQVQMKSVNSVENYIKKATEDPRMKNRDTYIGRLSDEDMENISYGVAVHLGFENMMTRRTYYVQPIRKYAMA